MQPLKCLVLLFFFVNTLFSCQQAQKQKTAPDSKTTPGNMQVKILNKILFADIPSASGLEIIEDKIYVVGDDSPYLYVLDLKTLKLTDTIPLFDSKDFGSGRIPKALKPDLECLTTIELAGEKYLLALGSGSAPTRDKAYTLKVPVNPGAAAEVREYSLEPLYRILRQNKEMLNGDLLNLEAAAATAQGDLFLWQRAAATGANVVLQFKTAEFMQSLSGTDTQLPTFVATPFNLPDIAGLSARFSGAYAYQNLLFFTASVENTNDAIQDGEVLGSFVGYMPVPARESSNTNLPIFTTLIRETDGSTYKGKVESIAIVSSEGQGTYRGLAFTDNDDGASELLELQITL
jgi:hypothetical protein